MIKQKIIVAIFALLLMSFFIPIKNDFADIAPQKIEVPAKEPDANYRAQDSLLIKNALLKKQNQSTELIRPLNIAIGVIVLVVVIISFIVLSKIRNKKS